MMKRLKQLSYFFLPIPLAAGAFAQEEKSIRIGSQQAMAATNFPPAMRIGNGQLDVAFCHMLMLPPWERALPAEDTQTLD